MKTYTHTDLKQMNYNRGQRFIANAKIVRGVQPSSKLSLRLRLLAFAIGYIAFIYLWHLALV